PEAIGSASAALSSLTFQAAKTLSRLWWTLARRGASWASASAYMTDIWYGCRQVRERSATTRRWPPWCGLWPRREVALSEPPRHHGADEGRQNGGADSAGSAGAGRGAGDEGFRA